MLRDHLILGTKDKKAQTLLFREKNVDLNIAVNCLQTNKLAQQQLKKINSTTFENVNFSKKKKINNVIKKMNKLLVTFRVSSVVKNMNLVKNFVQLGGKSVNCAKLKITLKVVLFGKKVKTRKDQRKIIQQILQKTMIIIQINHSLQ